MFEIHSKVLNQTIKIDRIIGRINGAKPGPCSIFFGGIHGNESSGVFALHQVFTELKKKKATLKGTFIAISGNIWALQRSKRFHKTDLNRLWTENSINALETGTFIPKNEDEKQQQEIYQILHELLNQETGPFYFFDLHTTSAPTIPFITVNDSLLNRKFTNQYPIPKILGIEECLEGPLLSYINELGYVSFGFEGGQHDALDAIENHKIFIYFSLMFSGILDTKAIDFNYHYNTWANKSKDYASFFEIYSKYEVKENEQFVMEPGFSNFQKVECGEHLATSDTAPIFSNKNSIIFMPLYQSQGNDGYFLIEKIPPFFLWLSSILRKFNVDRIFTILPGVKWILPQKDTMKVNLNIARFLTNDLLHLYGYRKKKKEQKYLIIKNREYRSRTKEYNCEDWYKNSLNEFSV